MRVIVIGFRDQGLGFGRKQNNASDCFCWGCEGDCLEGQGNLVSRLSIGRTRVY